jgi:hypothetical protein
MFWGHQHPVFTCCQLVIKEWFHEPGSFVKQASMPTHSYKQKTTVTGMEQQLS